MKRFFQKLTILLVICFGYTAEKSEAVPFNGFEVTSTLNEKKLRFKNYGYELKQVEQNGNQYIKPTIQQGDGLVAKPGEPYLPTVSTMYAISPNKRIEVQVEIIEQETLQNIDIIPFESWERDLTGNALKGNSYEQNKLFPSEIAKASDPIVMRDLVMTQITLTPFRYNPISKELIIIKDAEISLIETETSEIPFIPRKRSKEFEVLYESIVVNYSTTEREDVEYQRPAILYVLPNNIGNLFGTIEQLMKWKERVGYDVSFVSSSNIVNDRNNLKDYIENAYETWDNPPVHVNIVGDVTGAYDIPTWVESMSGYNGDGDHPYSTLEGGDNFPEVFLGRLSFETSSHLNTIVSKTINYESNPYMNENWFERACLVGDQSTSGISCVITNEAIHDILDMVGFEEVNTVYGGSFPGQMQSGISDGVSFFNYRGFYGVSGFGDSNVNGTSNGFMLPVATVITCGTGSFGQEEALSETFIRAGTSSNPKGSVVCIGTATTGTHTMFNNIVDMGFYYGSLIKNINSAGGALMYGKMMLYQNYPDNPNNFSDIFVHWNSLMGESSLQMWSAYPELTTVDHSYAIAKGTNFIDINVSKDIGNVENAWVTILMDGVMVESGYTNDQGFIRLPVSTTQTGEVLLTVTKKNHYPYQSSFQIYDSGVSVNIAENPVQIIDDNTGSSIGNSNATANSGETLELYINAKNYGSENSTAVLGTISSLSNNIEIASNSNEFGDMSAGGTSSNSLPYIVVLDEGIEDGTNLEIIVDFLDNEENTFQGILNIYVSGNKIIAGDIDVVGTATDILTPGMSSDIKINLENKGSTNSQPIAGTLTSSSPFIEIIDNSGSWSGIPSGESSYNGENLFKINALDGTIPGTIAYLVVNIQTDDGYASNNLIPLQIGVASVTDPVGPDSHGYYIYDNEDIDYTLAPVYNWIEIDDREGGPGTHLSALSDAGDNGDDVQVVNLPFTFTFYGQDYDQISICSNGWISMGSTDMESFRNYTIPGVGGPRAMIAVFWDDLKTTNGGRVYTWFDQSEKKFIVEWSEVRTYQNNSRETFQAVLFDPSYYPTPTGDGDILLQYKEFNNTSYGSYSWDQIHGDYCTIGIEDHTMTNGLQYTFNNGYHNSASTLSDETSILITTRGSGVRLQGDLNYDGLVDVNDLMLLVDYNLGYEGEVNAFFADTNGDGMVNVMDLISIIRIIMRYEG